MLRRGGMFFSKVIFKVIFFPDCELTLEKILGAKENLISRVSKLKQKKTASN